jgi:hypothetical protein
MRRITIAESKLLMSSSSFLLAEMPMSNCGDSHCDRHRQCFVVGNWIPKYSSGCHTKLPSIGQPVPAVSAVNGVVKHLSKFYLLLGYEGWFHPAKAEVVKAFRTEYEKALHKEVVKV